MTLDVEGLAARPGGGFVLAVEGEDGPGNALVWVGADGAIERRVRLPDDVAAGLGGQGLEGVAVDGDAVWVALQREVKGDPDGVARLGRYTDRWEWFGYPLERTNAEGDWIGLSEIAVHDGSLLVLGRDKLNWPDARVKAIYRVAMPDGPGAAAGETPPVLSKTLARNLLPDLQSTNGYVQEKVEGFAVAGNGRFYVVTDNDGFDDANGETQFFDLGPAGEALSGGRRSRSGTDISPTSQRSALKAFDTTVSSRRIGCQRSTRCWRAPLTRWRSAATILMGR